MRQDRPGSDAGPARDARSARDREHEKLLSTATQFAAWAVVGLAALAVGWTVLDTVALVGGPLVAGAAGFLAFRHSPPGRRAPWFFFSAAATVVLVGVALRATGLAAADGTGDVLLPPYTFLLAFQLLFAVGAALALRPLRARRLAAEVTLDAAIILAAAAVIFFRYVLDPLAERAAIGTAGSLLLLGVHLAWVASVFFVVLLFSLRDARFPAPAVVALGGATTAFGIGNVLLVTGAGTGLAGPDGIAIAVWLVGCGPLAFAGWAAARERVAVPSDVEPGRVAQRLRQSVVPGAALFLGAAALEAAFRPPLTIETGIALASLAALLAVRAGPVMHAAERHLEERRRLGHTSALVEVSKALAGATELNRALELVAQWACRLLEAPAGGIELLSEDERTLELRAVSGLPANVQGARVPADESLTSWVVRHGRPRGTADLHRVPFVRFRGQASLGHLPLAAAPLQFRDRTLGALFVCMRSHPFDARELELLGALADQAAIAIENARLFEQVRTLSLTDPLTGLANRRQLERDLAREFAAARRGREVVAILLDLDGFKEFNDRHGHLAGDEALRIFAGILADETRAMNLAARYGGDEFIVVMADTDVAGAEGFVDRVRARFSRRILDVSPTPLTLSAGIAAFRPEMQKPETLIAAADRALYRAKAARSRV